MRFAVRRRFPSLPRSWGECAFGMKTASARLRIRGDADVVLLDPMFPARTKSAAVKKKFQLLHLIEQPCADEEELFEAAVAAGRSRSW